jgi:hypothetical protein
MVRELVAGGVLRGAAGRHYRLRGVVRSQDFDESITIDNTSDAVMPAAVLLRA